MAWSGLRAAMQADPQGVRTTLAVAPLLRLPADELAWAIELESGWNPAAHNSASNASGLIQFLPSTLELLGFQRGHAAFRELTRREQAAWVAKFFERFGAGAWRREGDVRLMLMGRHPRTDDRVVLFDVGTDAWRLNPSLREPNDGPITARSVRRSGKLPSEPMPTVEVPPGGPGPAPGPAPRPAGPALDLGWLRRVPWPLWALVALYAARRRR